MPRVALHAASTPLGVWPPPPSFAPFPDPVHVRRTRSAGPHGTTPAPSPVYPQRGARPPFAPFPYARKGGAGQETRTPPPPPPLTRERGAAQEVTRHPRLHTTGTRQPPPTLHSRANRTRERGTSPRRSSRRSHLRARRGGAQERGARDRTRDGVGQGTHTPPFPLLPGTLRAMPEVARRPPRFARRGHAHEGSVRGDENGTRPPHPLRPAPICMHGPRANAGARSRLECTPGFARTGNVRTGTHRGGALSTTQGQASREGTLEPNANGRTHGSAPPPPSPSSRTRAKRERVAAWKHPPPSPACSCARAKRERATTRKPPLSRGFARKGETQPRGGSAPSSVYAGVHRSGGA
ncbi:hypothetical protein EDB89DRAFT_2070606 [Lactarius sanguifluus]|nr:hypothetical protein EDB89DRAFT_2070606 [Lactarius sanguifluus]